MRLGRAGLEGWLQAIERVLDLFILLPLIFGCLLGYCERFVTALHDIVVEQIVHLSVCPPAPWCCLIGRQVVLEATD